MVSKLQTQEVCIFFLFSLLVCCVVYCGDFHFMGTAKQGFFHPKILNHDIEENKLLVLKRMV